MVAMLNMEVVAAAHLQMLSPLAPKAARLYLEQVRVAVAVKRKVLMVAQAARGAVIPRVMGRLEGLQEALTVVMETTTHLVVAVAVAVDTGIIHLRVKGAMAASQAEAAGQEQVAMSRNPTQRVAQVDAEKSGCGFTNERHNKKKSSWR